MSFEMAEDRYTTLCADDSPEKQPDYRPWFLRGLLACDGSEIVNKRISLVSQIELMTAFSFVA